MFKKKCPKCERKIERKFEFCPFCGKNLKGGYDKEDYGFIGKNDIIESDNLLGIGGSFMDKLFNSAFKMMEKQMKEMQKEFNNPQPKTNPHFPGNLDIQFFVNGKRITPQKIPQKNIQEQIRSNQPLKISNKISKEKAERFSQLPKIEPKSKIRRLSGRIIYELSVPGVEDINDVLINQLENSIEIKALSKDKVYSKILNINLPIINYELEQENLIL